MPIVQMAMLMLGVLAALGRFFFAFNGPSASKAQTSRIQEVLERHSRSMEVTAQVHMKRLLGGKRTTQMEDWAQRFIPKPALLRHRLEQTGNNWTLAQYGLVTIGLVIAVGAFLTYKRVPMPLPIFVALFIGIGLPHFLIGKLIKRRVAKFTSKFPDAIELMVRGLRSGLPISETIGIVANEIQGPVGIEFQGVSDKMKIGRTMEAALQETADRLGTPEFQFFVITLAIQRETGGNLAETLSNLADVLRKRAGMKLKIRAMSSESKASAYIVGSLPFIVFGLVWMVSPGYLSGFFSEPRLMIAGGGGLVWMSIGVFIMAKMVDFEI
jgi:tight adherence protein B